MSKVITAGLIGLNQNGLELLAGCVESPYFDVKALAMSQEK